MGPRRRPVRLLPPGRPRTSHLPRGRQRATRLPVGRRARRRRNRDHRALRRVFDVFARPDLSRHRRRASRCCEPQPREVSETDVFTCDAARIAAARPDRIRAVPRLGSHPHARHSTTSPTCASPTASRSPRNGTAARATIWFDEVNLVGLFEPVETDEGFRRRGLARAVMTEGLHRMRAAGMRTAMVEHDITNAAAAAALREPRLHGRLRDRRVSRSEVVAVDVRLALGEPEPLVHPIGRLTRTDAT